ncbi:MAG: flagellar biosynthesis protein FlhF [Planctomycetota bacterium]
MIVKTFRAPTIAEALAKVKATVGDSALIIDTRRVRPYGALGFLRKRVHEIVVGIEDEPGTEPDSSPPAATARGAANMRAIERELEAIKDALHLQARGDDDLPPRVRELTARLVERGVDEPTARELAEEANAASEGGDLADRLQEALARRFRCAAPPPAADGPRVLALVGPPGVGKTTTLVKLAGRLIADEGARVALASVDFFRVGAAEQLKAYAEILDVPFHPVAEPADAARAVEAATTAQWLLVDTPGVPHHAAEPLQRLRTCLEAFPDLEGHLVLSATTDRDVAVASIEAYRAVGFKRVAFTKLDEALRHGGLVGVAQAAEVPVSYLADGQDVADHLAAAEASRLATLVLDGVPEPAEHQGT